MRVVTSLAEAATGEPSVVSIGNFDGLHLGHRAILSAVVQRAGKHGCRSVAMTFLPHTSRFLAPYKAPKLITTFRQKIELIESTGIDLLFVINFDEVLSQLSPQEFIQRYLVDGLRAISVCVGSNFNFGYRGSGSVQTLRESQAAFDVIEVNPVKVRSGVVSSTRVRELIQSGDISKACRLLGRWPELEGPIVSDAQRGRSVTVPTLNLAAENELIPARGVYITRISLDGKPFQDAVTNIGTRPTFAETTTTIETFILNGEVPEGVTAARLQFMLRLRDEAKFDSPESLRHQILHDVSRAQKFFRLLTK